MALENLARGMEEHGAVGRMTSRPPAIIDRSLNYGRHLVYRFLKASKPYRYVVDLGAGEGTDLLAARAVVPQSRCFAVEVYAPSAERLSSQGFEVLTLDIERDKLPFQSGTIDVVIANQILEHTKDVFWILHEVSRVLRVGGVFLLGIPNLAALHNRILLLAGRQPSPIKTASAHVRGFTKRDLLDFLERCFPSGYTVGGFGGSNFYPFPPFPAMALAACFPTLAWGIFFRLEKIRAYEGGFLSYPVKNGLQTNFYLG
jgi:SAM-dependent methyltransferase